VSFVPFVPFVLRRVDEDQKRNVIYGAASFAAACDY